MPEIAPGGSKGWAHCPTHREFGGNSPGCHRVLLKDGQAACTLPSSDCACPAEGRACAKAPVPPPAPTGQLAVSLQPECAYNLLKITSPQPFGTDQHAVGLIKVSILCISPLIQSPKARLHMEPGLAGPRAITEPLFLICPSGAKIQRLRFLAISCFL